jgi:hypothetical protein
MSVFLKAQFGDLRTVSVVAVVMTIEALFVATGHMTSAAFVVPSLVFAGAAWLATR